MISNKRRIGVIVIRILLGAIFLLSGIGKLLDSGYVNYDLVRLLSTTYFWVIEYAALIIISISIVELAVAILLLWGKKIRWALSIGLMMLVGFSSVLGYFYLQGMNVSSCGCFGAFGFSSGLGFTLIRNGVMMVLIIGAFILLSNKKHPKSEATI